ncbi:MAG: methylenetetrahydrofolate reductase C-terminal domain-containing protein, partial [Spartobacteria bacterium]
MEKYPRSFPARREIGFTNQLQGFRKKNLPAMDLVYESEKWLKEKMFGCKTCGQCILSHTSLICPMNCPKGLRNGPCGGTLDGKCEVIPEIDCVWTRIETKKKS